MAAKSPLQRSISATIAAIEKHNGAHDPRLPGLRDRLSAVRSASELSDWAERARALPPLDPAEVAAVGAIAARLDQRIAAAASGHDGQG